MQTKVLNLFILTMLALSMAFSFAPPASAAEPDVALPPAVERQTQVFNAPLAVNPVDKIGQPIYVASYQPQMIGASIPMTAVVIPQEDIDSFTTALTSQMPYMFRYATIGVLILMPVAVIGIGFAWGFGIVEKFGNMLKGAFH